MTFMMMRHLPALTMAAALFAMSWSAQARDAVTGPMGKQAAQACRADYKKLCDGVKPGEGRGLACLKQHESELSDGCKSALSEAKDCAAKARELCGAEGGDADKRRACLKAHAAELSQCKADKSGKSETAGS